VLLFSLSGDTGFLGVSCFEERSEMVMVLFCINFFVRRIFRESATRVGVWKPLEFPVTITVWYRKLELTFWRGCGKLCPDVAKEA